MTKRNYIIIVAVAGVAILMYIGYLYLYQNHMDVAQENAVAVYSSSELMELFTDSNLENDKKALNQVIEVNGMVTSLSDNELVIDQFIYIQLSAPLNITVNKNYSIKGRCLGYDELLEEIKMDQAMLVK